MGRWLSERLGQPFVIENQPGAGTNIATEAVVNASPDGYTLLMAGASNAINATFYDKLNYNFIRDIAPVAGIMRAPLVMVVIPSFPAKTVPEFIAYAKANPGKIKMASPGNGTAGHLCGELFKMMAGVDMIHMPYRGGASATPRSSANRCRSCSTASLSERAHQDWQTSRPRNNDRDARGNAAGHPDRGRVRAGLRGERLVRRGRSQGHAHRRCRQAQQRDQRRPCRS